MLGGGNRFKNWDHGKTLFQWIIITTTTNKFNLGKGRYFTMISQQTQEKNTQSRSQKRYKVFNLQILSTFPQCHHYMKFVGWKKSKRNFHMNARSSQNPRLTTYQQSHGILIQPPLGLEDTFITTKSSSLQICSLFKVL